MCNHEKFSLTLIKDDSSLYYALSLTAWCRQYLSLLKTYSDVRPKNEDFLTGLSNPVKPGQSTSSDTNWREIKGSLFCTQGRPAWTVKWRPSLKCFVWCDQTQNHWSLLFVDKVGWNYKSKTLTWNTLFNVNSETQNQWGLRFVDQAASNYQRPSLKCFVDFNGHEINGVFVL